MGLFDSSMFDLNGDGKVDIGEEFMAYKMYEDVISDDDEESDDEDSCSDDDDY